MKNFLFSLFVLVLLCMGANAENYPVNYMLVRTADGQIHKYEMENVTSVDYDFEGDLPSITAIYLQIHLSDGSEEKYNVADVLNVNYETVLPEADTTAQGVSVSGQIGGYTYVDLGLPSGTKWATYNVGASQPTDYIDLNVRWGETSKNVDDEWENYTWCEGRDSSFTKYCTSSDFGTVDNLTTLESSDDAATVNWGSSWRTPTKTEYQELMDGCDWTFLTNGNLLGISKTNGNTILFYATPSFGEITYGYSAAGHINYAMPNFASVYPGGAFYWTSTLDESNSSNAYAFDIYEKKYVANYIKFESDERYYPWSVRAVVNE